jgi:hypothetical protein
MIKTGRAKGTPTVQGIIEEIYIKTKETSSRRKVTITSKEDSEKKFASNIEAGRRINVPMTKMLFDYFNILQEDTKMQEDHNIFISGFFVSNGSFFENLPGTVSGTFSFIVAFEFEGMLIHFNIERYIMDGAYVQYVGMYSNIKTYVDGEVLMKVIFRNAIQNSDLKGKYLYLPAGPLNWDKKDLEKRSFDDIYLPQTITEDLKMFVKVYEKKHRIMRYLLAGNPGTGKTESVLAIANDLKMKNVTIIKTVVCDHLKEKMELAEMLAPSLLILDDIDMYLGSRKAGGFSSNLGSFLDVLDGTEKINHAVGIIATTNSIELLDLAAQRPGRFDRTLSFDDITKDNIKNIIIKSLKYNFQLKPKDALFTIFTNDDIIKLFYDSKVTGSHIYNAVKNLTLKIDVLDIINPTTKWIVSEIKSEIRGIDKVRNTSYLNDKLDRKDGGKIGFGKADDGEEMYEVCAPSGLKKNESKSIAEHKSDDVLYRAEILKRSEKRRKNIKPIKDSKEGSKK